MATARRFAAALGIIAFVFVAAFGVWRGNELDAVLLRALVSLVLFAALGFVTGLVGAAVANDAANQEMIRRKRAEEEQRRRQAERPTREKRGEGTAGGPAGETGNVSP